MNKQKTIILILILIAIVFTTSAQAQTASELGCCCDKRITPATGAIDTKGRCDQLGREFKSLTAQTASISDFYCDSVCKTTALPTQPAPATDCKTTGVPKAPTDLTITPIKGQLAVKLDFVLSCPADYIKISRCAGAGCGAFQQIDLIPPQQFYVDESPTLNWGQDYTYQIVAKYNILGESDPVTKSVNTGDIECGTVSNFNRFCLDQNYYAKYEPYLKANGYAVGDYTRTGQDFKNSFDATVQFLFTPKFNKAFTCNPNNKLSQPVLSCKSGEYCVSTPPNATCINGTNPCIDDTNIFGLFSTVENCEFKENTQEKKYCFLDKSGSLVDSCYSCNSKMNCYDYKSQGACERNNCGAGQCEWTPIFSDIGTGVCTDKRFNNCPFCGQTGTATAPNAEAYNSVFDQCTKEKAQALSTQKYPCFYQDTGVGGQAALTCDAVTCKDYKTKAQCAANLTYGVTLNADNTIATPSKDMCAIKVCQWDDALGCVKNADGTSTSEVHWYDCDSTDKDKTCEKDYFPPETTIIPSGKQGRTDFLMVRVTDKTNKTMPLMTRQGTQELYANYTTYICTYPTGGTPCTTFNATNSTKLNLNDATLKLQDYRGKELVSIVEGFNKIRYYTKDPNKNLEVVKETTFQACKNCSGPQIIDFTVSHSKLINGTYYTSDIIPIITVRFNKDSELTTLALNKSTLLIPLTQTPTGAATNFAITVTSAQQSLTEGMHTLTLNAKDKNEHYMDDVLVQPIFVKTSKATVNITPSDKEVLLKNVVTITLNFSEPVTLRDVILQEEFFASGYIKKINNTNTTAKFTTKDNKFYTAMISSLMDGQHTIKVFAEDVTGASVIANSTFYVNTKTNQIFMARPRFGIAPDYTFDINIETSLSKGRTSTPYLTCKWQYDNPVIPPAKDFTYFTDFDQEYDNKHIIKNFKKIQNDDTSAHNFYVYCKDDKGNITQKTFQLSVDTVTPNIISAFAAPNPITEELVPNSSQYLTTLKVQTDKPTFCKYSESAKDFDAMEGYFPGYEELPNTVNIADVLVNKEKGYTYYVQCQSIAGKPTQAKAVPFTVNTKVPFDAISTTARYFNTTTPIISLETNKRAYCYYSTNKDSLTDCMGECNYTSVHLQPITLAGPGTYSYYAKCSRGTTGETTPVMEIKFTVDNTPPRMIYVNDTSVLPGEPDVSPYKDKLLVAFLGTDEDTNVTQYLVAFENARTKNLTMTWTPSTHLDGRQFFMPENGDAALADGEKYFVHVRAVNPAGLQSEEMISDGVTTNFSRKAPGKLDGENCKKDIECISNYCEKGVCKKASCTDEVKNGHEADVDCGGGDCTKCDKDKKCRVTSDCKSGLSCNSGRCEDLGPCFDAVLTEGGVNSETDIDCGGACVQKCAEGKKCRATSDCETGLLCADNSCKSAEDYDSDKDGVSNDKDKCPSTKAGEKVDENGCADSQKFSLGDEIPDSWRLKYFGCIDCPEAAADADPDNDGLTNIEEYRLGTNPTDPLDPGKAKMSWLSLLLWILLILLILGGIGVGGYLLYQYYQTEQEKKAPVRVISATAKAAGKPQIGQQVPKQAESPVLSKLPKPVKDTIDSLRKLVRPKEGAPQEKEWLPLQELKKRILPPRKEEKPAKEQAPLFKRLQALSKKQPVEVETQEEYIPLKELSQIGRAKTTAKKIKETKQTEQPFNKLRELSNKSIEETAERATKKAAMGEKEITGEEAKKIFERLTSTALKNLSPEEREELLKKLKLMRQNKLGQDALETLLKKLRITSQYYKTNKDALKKQLQEWLKQK